MKHLKGKVAGGVGVGPNMGGTIAYVLVRQEAKLMVMDVNQAAADNTADVLGAQGYKSFSKPRSALEKKTLPALLVRPLRTTGKSTSP